MRVFTVVLHGKLLFSRRAK